MYGGGVILNGVPDQFPAATAQLSSREREALQLLIDAQCRVISHCNGGANKVNVTKGGLVNFWMVQVIMEKLNVDEATAQNYLSEALAFSEIRVRVLELVGQLDYRAKARARYVRADLTDGQGANESHRG